MASKKEKLRTQRNRTKGALGIVTKANNTPDRFDEVARARVTLARMNARYNQLAEQDKLYRLRIPEGECIGTYDIVLEYADKFGIAHDQIKLNTIERK